jgi:hypothetical protein
MVQMSEDGSQAFDVLYEGIEDGTILLDGKKCRNHFLFLKGKALIAN